MDKCECPTCKKIDLFETIVNERNFDKLAWFCRSVMIEPIKQDRLIEIYKLRGGRTA